MANAVKKPGSWGKPPVSDKLERRERRFRILNNLATVLLTGIIIAGGFMLPTLLYPYLDFFHDDMVQIADPLTYTAEENPLENPVTLYPWNIYDVQLCRSLSTSEREFLINRGFPIYLLESMRNRGMQMEKTDLDYHMMIINSFSYLEPQDSNVPGCYVLSNFDANEDGIADLRFAAASDGSIISLLFLSDMWDTITVESPIGVPSTKPADQEQSGQEGTGNKPGEEGKPSDNNPSQTEGTATTGPGQNPAPNGTQQQGENQPSGNTNASESDPTLQRPPVDEDLNIWSFSYAVSREARMIGQQSLFQSFRQLEFYYESRYGYPYTKLLPNQPLDDERLPEVEELPLTPQPLKTDQYSLLIYYLPTGEQLTLYLSSDSRKCLGFNLAPAGTGASS